MSDVATTVQEPVQTNQVPDQQDQKDVNQSIADSLWGTVPAAPEPPANPQVDVTQQQQSASQQAPTDEAQVIDVDEYFKQNYGIDAAAAKAEWESLRKLRETPPPPSELQFQNEESKRFFELFKEGKTQEIRDYLNQQDTISRLESYDINNVTQAAEIIKANLQFKHKDLSPQQIDRLFARQYIMPEKPVQDMESDEEFKPRLDAWQRQVQEKEQDLIIDATLAKPELSKFKSQIVLPDIPQANQPQQQGPTPEELAAAKAGRDAYLQALNSNFQNFKGFSVTAKDGDVQLPVEYLISPEELNASKQEIEDWNPTQFFDNRWWANGQPNINLIQEDLYLLKNRDKIFQKIANEAAAQRFLHHQKLQNNINLNSVNNQTTLNNEPVKNESQTVADQLWKL